MSIRGINRAHILCSSFAFYDFEPMIGDRAKRWFDYCVSVAEEIGHPLDEGCCNPGNTKYVLLRNCKRGHSVLSKHLLTNSVFYGILLTRVRGTGFMNKKISFAFMLLLSACASSVKTEDYSTFDCGRLKAEYKKTLLEQLDSFNERMKEDDPGLFSMVFGTTDKSSVSYREKQLEKDLNYLRSLLSKKNCAQDACKVNNGEKQ